MEMKRRTVVVALSVAAALVFSNWVGNEGLAQNKPMVLKLGHGATADHPVGRGMLKFAELVNAKTGGSVKVETYLAGSLYNERTALEGIVNGAIDFAGASNANWAAFTDALLFMDLPYVFNDEASFRKVLDGPVGTEIRQRFEKAGFKLLMELDNGGFRDIVNNKRPVRVPADLKGLKFRTTASPVEIAMFRNWGAIPTAIDWAEVYSALGSGVVDGEFVMPTWLNTAKHYEVLRYATQAKAAIGIQTLAMRKERFDQLPPDVQNAILDAAKEAQAYTSKLDAEATEASRAVAVKLGVMTYAPTTDEMKIWRSTGREIWKQFEGKVDKSLLQQVLDSQGEKQALDQTQK
jgi:TRAP-type transport system periplasmic protein